MDTVTSYQPCRLCPRCCGTSRISPHKAGYCGESATLRLACAAIHRGEEPPLTGTGGSGTIFVSGCGLGCVFCQNWQISGRQNRLDKAVSGHQSSLGKAVDAALFVRICLALQERGAENINIVTGSHAVPALAAGIAAAKAEGLSIPVLWNSSGYERPETLEMLADTVDVFLPDLKTLDTAIAARYFNAPDYPEFATAAIKKMIDMRPLRFEERRFEERQSEERESCQARTASLVSGVMVRHLVLPGHLEASREVLRWFADLAGGSALFSLMFQYTAPGAAAQHCSNADFPIRCISPAEYDTVLGWLTEFGIEDGYCQELVPGTDWLPDFERDNPFPPDMAVPVWHWKKGFVPPDIDKHCFFPKKTVD